MHLARQTVRTDVAGTLPLPKGFTDMAGLFNGFFKNSPDLAKKES
ncbi:hypothetical protein FHS18_000936 [Paenibacillus phyllosphaerae]|uniref:Uncharacterized protein n=1 Tax=Paenibacillus phyllosphaerae TaxID=274593 RepID=A0A7W5FLC8_9BACL|nr:hypothetical protein [Paenibacillus phyllosphaerae]